MLETAVPKNQILVDFDPVAQAVAVKFNRDDFKTYDFALAVLMMAKDALEAQRQDAMVQQRLLAMQGAAQDQAIRRQLQRGVT